MKEGKKDTVIFLTQLAGNVKIILISLNNSYNSTV